MASEGSMIIYGFVSNVYCTYYDFLSTPQQETEGLRQSRAIHKDQDL